MEIMARLLAARRPPALVMEWVRGQDIGHRMASAGRNDPCPYGSGGGIVSHGAQTVRATGKTRQCNIRIVGVI
jgi:hypothetical protein